SFSAKYLWQSLQRLRKPIYTEWPKLQLPCHRAIFGRLRQAKRELEHAKQGLEKLQKNIQTDSAQVAQAQARVAAWATSVKHWQEVGRAWRQHWSKLALI